MGVKRCIWWVVWALLVLVLSAWGPPLLEGGDPRRPWMLTPDDARRLYLQRHPPEVPARAALVYDVDADRVLLAQDAHVPLPPASLTKLMTALVAREHLRLDQEVIVPPEALVPATRMGLRPGERVQVRTLLYGLLLPSGSDAAITLAVAAAGDVDTFVVWMNAKARDMGLENTHFANPHGLDAPGHVSTAWDLARIAQAVLDDPVLADIVATSEVTVGGYRFVNRNRLLREREDVVGVKTGTTPLAKECLVAAFRLGQHRVITVVLGSQDRYQATLQAWTYYREAYQWLTLRLPPGRMNRVLGSWGERAFRVERSAAVLMPRWEVGAVRPWREVIGPTLRDGVWVWPERAGRAYFYAGGAVLVELPLVWTGEQP